MSILRCVVLPLVVSLASAQRSVWIVDVANGPGAHFTSLQQAADSPLVRPGDVLQLRPGQFASLQTQKPLCLLGTPQSALGHVHVSAIPAGSEFVIHGARATAQPGLAMIEAWACPGRIVISGLDYYPPGSAPQWAMQRLVAAADCPDLEIADIVRPGLAVLFGRCTATLRNCLFVRYGSQPDAFAFDAVVAHQSDLELVDCRVRGSSGGLATGIGLRVVDGTVRVRATGIGSASVLAAPNLGGGPAPAVQMTRTTVECDPLVQLGPVVNAAGTFTLRSMPALSASIANGAASATLFAQSGSVALIGFGFACAPTPYAAGAALRVDLAFGMACGVVATLPPSGMLTTSSSVPTGVEFLGARFVAQGAVLSGAQVELANAAALLVR